MKKITLIYIVFISSFLQVYATHNRAGEITYKQLSMYTYEVTVYTYTNTAPGVVADRPELTVEWGDNTSTVVRRDEQIYLPYYYKRNKYIGVHTFPGPGTFEIVVQDPNRNEGVINIASSVNVMFAIKTTLKIDPNVGFNNTPVLLNPPYDKAFVGKTFVHNPAAFDSDGDSLSYRLTTCLGADGKPLLEDYTLPSATHRIYVDSISGDLIWDAPKSPGKYNVAMAIDEWRGGIKIGQIIRDMQIEVSETTNHPPDIKPLPDLCVEAGALIEFDVIATDPDTIFKRTTHVSLNSKDTIVIIDTILDRVTLTATGGPLILSVSPATFKQPVTGKGRVVSHFKWQTTCAHIRKTPYQMIFKAEDDYKKDGGDLHLFDYQNVNIRVISPPPQLVNLSPTSRSITVTWEPPGCKNITGYRIYRKENRSGFTPDSCETGVPGYTGYKYIGKTDSLKNITFFDNNDGAGLGQGVEYCYLVTAVFADGAESYASNEMCAVLERGIPVITNVSVNNTSKTNGSMYLAWAEPTELDTVFAPGPYKYLIYRSNDFWGKNLKLIDSVSGLSNIKFTDTLLNTKDNPYSYKIELWNVSKNNRFLIGTPQVASSVYITPKTGVGNQITVRIDNNTPWTDTAFVVFRQNKQTGAFDSIGITKTKQFIDVGLENGQSYCYKALSIGFFPLKGIIDPILNYSQVNCGTPIDTIPPCAPPLTVTSNCESWRNQLTWFKPNDTCLVDFKQYNIYYSNHCDSALKLLTTIPSPDATSFTHQPESSLAACYALTAKDIFNNETTIKGRICVDACSFYELPNSFTPNADNVNDFFRPISYKSVEKVDVKIYNRWGKPVFESTDGNPEINWDGKDMESKKIVPDGVYYYVADIYEKRICGTEPRYLIGFIQVFTNKEDVKKP